MNRPSRDPEYRQTTVPTARGPIEVRVYEPVFPSEMAAVFVGGVGGGFDTPARELYPTLCRKLRGRAVRGVRVRYRNSAQLEEAQADVDAVIRWFAAHGVQRIALVGHSLGGAVVIDCGARAENVALVVALAPQSHGTGRARELSPRMLAIVHGLDDHVLPPDCARDIYGRARDPKALHLLAGAGHGLAEAADRVQEIVMAELERYLLGADRAGRAGPSAGEQA